MYNGREIYAFAGEAMQRTFAYHVLTSNLAGEHQHIGNLVCWDPDIDAVPEFCCLETDPHYCGRQTPFVER